MTSRMESIKQRLESLNGGGMGFGGMTRVFFNDTAPADITWLLARLEEAREMLELEEAKKAASGVLNVSIAQWLEAVDGE